MKNLVRFTFLACLMLALAFFATSWNTSDVSANHPVLVEGEQDFDGDGLLGADENNDSASDQVFGTINAALAGTNAGANQNGVVVVVTSGRFLESVTITGANGNVTLEAAPGVSAMVEAVRAGDANNGMRQTLPGIVVNSPANRIVTVRNMVSRNWTDGIQVMGASRAIIDSCRVENNTNFGIHVLGSAKVTVSNSTIASSGFRSGAAPANNNPNPGIGIGFEGSSTGTVAFSTISGSTMAGISNKSSAGNKAVGVLSVNAFDNNPNFDGVKPVKNTVPALVAPGDDEDLGSSESNDR
jgi:parallel beta-helix repeat protein